MSPKELKALIKTLRSLGVTSYEVDGVKLSITPEAPKKLKAPKISAQEETKIKHKLEEMTSLMKMDDMSLVDRLFPDHQPAQEDQH